MGRWVSCDPSILISTNLEATDTKNSDYLITIITQLNLYLFVFNNPVIYVDPDGEEPVYIGKIYIIEGTLGGEQVRYTGQTAQEIRKRFSKHEWRTLLAQKTTVVGTVDVEAELNISSSNKGNYLSARKEALSAIEQEIIDELDTDTSRTNQRKLNKIRAATDEKMTMFKSRHKAQRGKVSVYTRTGVQFNIFVLFSIFDAYVMWKDYNVIGVPTIFEDEIGEFIIQPEGGWWGWGKSWYKTYQSFHNDESLDPEASALRDSILSMIIKTEISASEADWYFKENEALYGYFNWKNDWVPGLLRREIPVWYGEHPNPLFRPITPKRGSNEI